ncbi:hypothetical protein, partial [Nocardia tengchongensis]|uniref:hypothetical protein n=1 Tax=Nocardia tengchongensis TaxID=2055889 RepID=UPI0036802A9D
MTPRQRFSQLGADHRRLVHLSLCEEALPTWIDYVQGKRARLRYRDSVVGIRHHVDVELPTDALRSAHAGTDLADIGGRYLEPISALQDDDLTFPDPVEFAYYAIYNCFRKYACGDDIPVDRGLSDTLNAAVVQAFPASQAGAVGPWIGV